MQLDAILEVAIGLVITWLILSMATSQIQEFIVERMNWRSKFLEHRLQEMFHKNDIVEQFYNHPLIQSLHTKSMLGKLRKPVSIPNAIFAQAAVDVFLNAGKSGKEVPAGSMNISGMKKHLDESMKYFEENNQAIARTLKYLVPNLSPGMQKAGSEAEKLESSLAKYRGNAETWFDTTMSQASAVYRKNAQTIALIIGILLDGAFNVDSIYITGELWRDPTLRQSIVAQAANIDPQNELSVEQAKEKLEELSLPIGWTEITIARAREGLVLPILGIIITGLAAAQGAPFWFDILRKLVGAKQQQSTK